MATTELPQGGTIGSYRVIRRIGQGGMGVVYEVDLSDFDIPDSIQ